MLFINPVLMSLPMKPLRQPSTRPVITYKPRVEPTPPSHAWRAEGFKDVWVLQNKYVAFVLVGMRFASHRPSRCRSRHNGGRRRCVRKTKYKKRPLMISGLFAVISSLAMSQFSLFFAVKNLFIRLFHQLTGDGTCCHRAADVKRSTSHINQGFYRNQQSNQSDW